MLCTPLTIINPCTIHYIIVAILDSLLEKKNETLTLIRNYCRQNLFSISFLISIASVCVGFVCLCLFLRFPSMPMYTQRPHNFDTSQRKVMNIESFISEIWLNGNDVLLCASHNSLNVVCVSVVVVVGKKYIQMHFYYRIEAIQGTRTIYIYGAVSVSCIMSYVSPLFQ